MQTASPHTAVFCGSFDPYTVGHHDVLTRFLPLFDRIVIGVGVNVRKQYMLTEEERVEQIRKIYEGESKVEVQTYQDLTVDFATRQHARYIIKGVRSAKDFEYEREQAEANKLLRPQIETILVFASPDKACISSSMLRELKHFGKDITPYLP